MTHIPLRRILRRTRKTKMEVVASNFLFHRMNLSQIIHPILPVIVIVFLKKKSRTLHSCESRQSNQFQTWCWVISAKNFMPNTSCLTMHFLNFTNLQAIQTLWCLLTCHFGSCSYRTTLAWRKSSSLLTLHFSEQACPLITLIKTFEPPLSTSCSQLPTLWPLRHAFLAQMRSSTKLACHQRQLGQPRQSKIKSVMAPMALKHRRLWLVIILLLKVAAVEIQQL